MLTPEQLIEKMHQKYYSGCDKPMYEVLRLVLDEIKNGEIVETIDHPDDFDAAPELTRQISVLNDYFAKWMEEK